MVRLMVGVVLGAFVLTACNDPKDPQTWIKKLRDPEKQSDAVKNLEKLGDPVAVKPLCDLFNDFETPEILKAIISFKDKSSIPTLIKALDFTEEKYHNATLAAKALSDLKATEAVDVLNKVLERPMPIRSRANLAKLAAISALAVIGDKRAVPALISTLERPPEEQDFLLNKQAAVALGELRDPRAISVLIRGLFMASTVQGPAFPHARVALVQIGTPAIQPLLAAFEGKDEKLNEMAKKVSFEEGVVVSKTARILGDLEAKEAVPAMIAALEKVDVTQETRISGVIEALGKIGDPAALQPLLKILRNKKANWKVRTQVALVLPVLGDKRALPPLLELAEKGYIEGGYDNLREAAAIVYSRMVGAEATPEVVAKFKSLAAQKQIAQETKGVFEEALKRIEVAVKCKDDSVCYGKVAADQKAEMVEREKAGVMIGILPGGHNALEDLIRALPEREPVLRLYFLQSAWRIGTSKDAKLIKLLEELAEKDSKRKVNFLGADLATEDKVTLAALKRKS